jgi:hypothetical protein
MQLDTLSHFVPVALLAFGMSYVVTGSVIGFPVRFVWWKLTRWGSLRHLAFCPACCAWWCGLAVALVTGSPVIIALQDAFVACGVAAAAQSQFGLAANDEHLIAGKPQEEKQDGEGN